MSDFPTVSCGYILTWLTGWSRSKLGAGTGQNDQGQRSWPPVHNAPWGMCREVWWSGNSWRKTTSPLPAFCGHGTPCCLQPGTTRNQFTLSLNSISSGKVTIEIQGVRCIILSPANHKLHHHCSMGLLRCISEILGNKANSFDTISAVETQNYVTGNQQHKTGLMCEGTQLHFKYKYLNMYHHYIYLNEAILSVSSL